MPYYYGQPGLLPFMGFFKIAILLAFLIWLVFLVLAFLVYKDADKRGLNGLLWGLPILIPWLGAIFLILYLILRDGGQLAARKTRSSDILDERYAKGELTRDQYLSMKEDTKI
ncbi:MAG: SHOCT domain-containing protein [Methanotrichaceae archaeon]|jgi:putative membrane protein